MAGNPSTPKNMASIARMTKGAGKMPNIQREKNIKDEILKEAEPGNLSADDARYNVLKNDIDELKKLTATQAGQIKQEEQIIKKEGEEIVKEEKSRLQNYKEKIKNLQNKIPSNWRFWLALGLAILFDALDFVGASVPVIGDIFDAVESLIIGFLLGPMYGIVPGVWEIGAGFFSAGMLDMFVPSYFISVVVFWIRTKSARQALKSAKTGADAVQKSLKKGLFGFSEDKPHIKYIYIGMFILIVGLIAGFGYPLIAGIFAGLVLLILATKKWGAGVFFAVLLIGIISIFFLKWDPLTGIKKFPEYYQDANARGQVALQNFNPIAKIKSAYDKAMYNTLGYGYYEGEVEKNKKGNLGVYISKLDTSMYSPFYADSDIVVMAKLRGRSFKENMLINASCYMRKSGISGILEKGVTDPPIITVDIPEYSFYEDVFCTFKNKSKGTYIVDFIAEFDFETWAYTRYTFVDRDLLRIYGDRINQELDIEEKAKAVYTNGPVQIGMSSEDYSMPIPINKNDSRVPGVFGVTIENKGQDGATVGEVLGIKSMEIIIPNSLSLSSCRPTTVSIPDPRIYPENDKYIFYSVNDFDLKDNAFRSVMCTMQVENYNMLLGSDPKSVKSMIVKTTYRYRLKKSATLNVEDPNAYLEYT